MRKIVDGLCARCYQPAPSANKCGKCKSRSYCSEYCQRKVETYKCQMWSIMNEQYSLSSMQQSYMHTLRARVCEPSTILPPRTLINYRLGAVTETSLHPLQYSTWTQFLATNPTDLTILLRTGNWAINSHVGRPLSPHARSVPWNHRPSSRTQRALWL